MISKTFLKIHASLLIVILVVSFFLVINPIPVKAQTVRIVDVMHPDQVRVRETFYYRVEIFYEATGPTEIDVEVLILDETDTEVGMVPFNKEIPDGVTESTTCILWSSLTAPDSIGTWNLRALLIVGNDMPFSIDVVGDEVSPTVRIVDLAADPESLPLGDPVNVEGTVEFSIPAGSFFIIYVTTSQGLPTILDPAHEAGLGIAHPAPWFIAPDGYPLPIEEIARAGEDFGGAILPSSGLDPFSLPGDAPFEPGDWVWTFKIVYFGPDGEETQLGRREITVEVETRTEEWVSVDSIESSRAFPDAPYFVHIDGRYFFPDEIDHEIEIRIWDNDLDIIPPGDSQKVIPVSGSGYIREIFSPTAPPPEFSQLNLTGMFIIDGVPALSLYEIFRVLGEALPEGPVEIFFLEITHIGATPEVEFGNPYDLHVVLDYLLPFDVDTPMEIHVSQHGFMWHLASEYATGRGEGHDRIVDIRIPSELVPPRNGEWPLDVIAVVWNSIFLISEYPLPVNVIGAEEGISGGSSDWMLLDGWPSNPMAIEGEEMSFWAVIGVETTDDLPQQVWLTLEIDGVEIVREAVTYLDGMVQLDFQSLSPWIATPGSHTAVWTVDPDEDYVDPDRDNNQIEFTFEVVEAMPLPSDGVVPGEEPPEPEEEFNFYVTANPTEGTLASSESYSISVELVSGESQLVQLALVGVPAGLSYSFNPSGGIPPYMSELTVTGSSNLPAGTYSMIINATDGVRVRYKPIILNVEKGADYELSISPGSIKGQPGDIVEFTISATSDSGYNQLVNLVVSRVPDEVVGQLESSADKPDFQSILSIYIGEDVGAGIHDIIVTGSGIEPHQVHSTLIIEEGDEDGTVQEDGGRNLSYYLPLVYLVAILAAVVGGATYGIKRLRKPKKLQAFCIECGKKIPADAKKCPKCDAKQEE